MSELLGMVCNAGGLRVSATAIRLRTAFQRSLQAARLAGGNATEAAQCMLREFMQGKLDFAQIATPARFCYHQGSGNRRPSRAVS